MRNIRIIGLCVIAVITLSVIWAVSLQGTPQANAQENRCNTSNVAGSYAYTAFGTILPGQPLGAPAGPFTTAGVVTLNKDGTYNLRANTSLSGTFFEENISDVYTIDDACATTLMYNEMPYTITYTTEDRKDIFGIVLVPQTNVAIIGSRK